MHEIWNRLWVPAAVVIVVALGVGATAAIERFRQVAALAPAVASPTPAPRPVKVHVLGAVAAPDVYALTSEDRIEDAIRAAGGPTDDGDPHRLNLAARLRDGEQIVVPRRTEAMALSPLTAAERPAADGLIDLNQASAAELEALPGIGKVLAERIVQSRQRDGPFTRVEELRERRLIGATVLDRIRDKVVAR